MNSEDIIIGKQYSTGGRIVTVYAKHEHIDNHYYIRFEDERGGVDTARRENLYSLECENWTNHVATKARYPKK